MIAYSDFKKYFNNDFWKSFKRLPFDIKIPEKERFIKLVYDSIVTKRYYPSTPIRYIDIDKGNGVARTVPVFDLKDYCVYYFCIKILESKIAINRVQNTFGGWTLGGVMRQTEDEEVSISSPVIEDVDDMIEASTNPYSFNPYAWSKVYGDFNSKLYATAKTFNGSYVAELDIANFYDSVRLDILENKIREITTNNESEVVSLLFHFLNYWNREINFYNGQTVGLPQDALGDFSRILANFYLQDYDLYMKAKAEEVGGSYFRYADDQFLFAPDEDGVKKLVFFASKKLNCFGLSINQKKVVYRKTEELITYRSFDVFEILANEETRDNPDIIESFADEYLKIRSSGLDSLKGKGLPLVNKLLFRKIELLPVSKKMVILSDLLDDNYISIIKADKFERIYSLLYSKDRKKFINQLLKLSQKNYHNSFHYELIKFLKSKKIDSSTVKERVAVLQKLYK
jgi:hypothetical protein